MACSRVRTTGHNLGRLLEGVTCPSFLSSHLSCHHVWLSFRPSCCRVWLSSHLSLNLSGPSFRLASPSSPLSSHPGVSSHLPSSRLSSSPSHQQTTGLQIHLDTIPRPSQL